MQLKQSVAHNSPPSPLATILQQYMHVILYESYNNFPTIPYDSKERRMEIAIMIA